jgi:hypothetical protein
MPVNVFNMLIVSERITGKFLPVGKATVKRLQYCEIVVGLETLICLLSLDSSGGGGICRRHNRNCGLAQT